MPQVALHRDGHYRLTWEYLSNTASADDALANASAGTRSLEIDIDVVYEEPGAVIVRGRARRDGSWWVPRAAGAVRLTRLDELDPQSDSHHGHVDRLDPEPGGGFDVGAADSGAGAPPGIIVYGASWSKASTAAAAWCTAEGVAFVERDVEQDADARAELARKLAAAHRPDPGVLPILDVSGRLLVGFSPATTKAALMAPDEAAALLHMGTGSGPGGLDPNLPEPLARSVEGAFRFESEPAKLRAFAATLRSSGFELAAVALERRALSVRSDSPESTMDRARDEHDKRTDRDLKVVGVAVAVATLLVALGKS
jgi:hypothetical protein